MYVKTTTNERFSKIEDALCPFERGCSCADCADCRAFCREHPDEAMEYLDLRMVLDED